jgi:hypothetical protein
MSVANAFREARCGALNPMPETAAFRRSPAEVMRLSRLGSFHRTRLSFLDTLVRRAAKERWTFERALWQMADDGVGRAVYTVDTGPRRYSLVAFAHALPDDQRSDRVIATRWDATFALFDGVPTTADLTRLEGSVPLQEAGRVTAVELCLSRANRSVRLFEHVVEALAAGRQPDLERVAETGYLMRTTAVYGSGKFGAADRDVIAARPELKGPFQAEMLTVWLIRVFTVDLVECLAAARGGSTAARLTPALRTHLGVGNATGLGMAPFLVRHPVLINNWMMAREEALARVRGLPTAADGSLEGIATALLAARRNAAEWRSAHPVQQAKLADLGRDLVALDDWLAEGLRARFPFDALWRRAAALSEEGQEALVSILLEPHGELVDGLSDCMDADEGSAFRIDGTMKLAVLRRILSKQYHFALTLDYEAPENVARFWYTSEEKLEPRLGERFGEPGEAYEEPLGVGRDVAGLFAALNDWPLDGHTAAFLARHPEHRHTVRRVQTAARFPFSEIRDNLIGSRMMPIDLLRCKLSFFGATQFDPRSDRWVRVTLFRDAPQPDDILAPA